RKAERPRNVATGCTHQRSDLEVCPNRERTKGTSISDMPFLLILMEHDAAETRHLPAAGFRIGFCGLQAKHCFGVPLPSLIRKAVVLFPLNFNTSLFGSPRKNASRSILLRREGRQ